MSWWKKAKRKNHATMSSNADKTKHSSADDAVVAVRSTLGMSDMLQPDVNLDHPFREHRLRYKAKYILMVYMITWWVIDGLNFAVLLNSAQYQW